MGDDLGKSLRCGHRNACKAVQPLEHFHQADIIVSIMGKA